MGKFENCLAVTLPHEGGWADHPKDPGGATMKGVTLATFRRYVPEASKADLRAISDKWVQTIYRDGYWEPVRGDSLPAGVDLAVFDFGVNSGPSRAVKALQSTVGVLADGKAGKVTLDAVRREDPAELVKAVCGRRLGFVRGLKTFSTFGKGWARRIADVEARGVKMAEAAFGIGGVKLALVLKNEADLATGKANTQDRAAAGVAGTGAAGGVGGVGADVNWWIIAGVAVVVVGLLVLVRSRAMINRERALAYAAVASE